MRRTKTTPNRSESAVILAATLAVVLLSGGILLLDAFDAASAAAPEYLSSRDPESANQFQLVVHWALHAMLLYPAIVCLFLAGTFTALAVASRIGPRWTVVASGITCAVGTFVLMVLFVVRSMTGVANYIDYEVHMWLKEEAATWFQFSLEYPLLVTVIGLPTVGVLLIHRHLKNHSRRAAQRGAPVWLG